MDKSQKLQRYSRKDYSEMVGFPVEIVGRDGVVRRYSFEDSIRLYQRRVTFAPIRYRDEELVEAEVGHCKSRIDQLRRSYFQQHGWGTPAGEVEPLTRFGPVAGEIAAFLCRVLRVSGRPEVSVSAIDSDDTEVGCYSVRPFGTDARMNLYVHAFGPSDPRRDTFFSQLKVFEAGTDPDERLVAFHHTADCGLVLTARSEDLEALENWQVEDEEWQDPEPSDLDMLFESLRKQDFRTALDRARTLVTEQPWHRSAYVLGAVAAVHLEDGFQAEEFGLLGSMYFDDDADLLYLAGMGRSMQGRRDDAITSLRAALRLRPDDHAARTLEVLLHLDRGTFNEAARTIAAHEGRHSRLTLLTGLVATRFAVLYALPAVALIMGAVAIQSGALFVLLASWGLMMATAILHFAWPPLHTVLVSDRGESLAHSLDRAKRTGAPAGVT